MTPQQKAEELFENLKESLMWSEDAKEDAKQCALVAVDEIISLDYNVLEYYGNLSSTDYWKEVKQEIEKL